MRFPFLRCALLMSLVLTATAQAAAPEDAIRAQLKQAMPDAEITRIDPSPVPGLYKVTSKNYEPVFASADGHYLVQGEMLEIKGNQIVSVTDQARAAERKVALAAVKPADMVIFPAIGKTKAVVYAFTDVDCPYCHKLHQEIPALNKMGVEIRYLAFPRSGPNTPASKKMDGVWCAKDRLAVMTQANRGLPVAPAPALCKSPVVAQYQLGESLGVHGTPAVFGADGMELGGYLPAADLAKALGLR
jgi:thiol:disulfide interchange protein DsbC